jgi:hypothetical protein
MARSLPTRLAVALATGAAASTLVAASALATEPGGPPPGPPLPGGVTPVTIPPVPTTGAPATRVVRRARIVPRRVRRGRKATLRMSLSSPSRLQVVLSRSRSGHRVRTLDIPAGGRSVSVRLPARAAGRMLRPGRYRVSIVAIDALGTRSRPVVRTLIVRRGARR